MAIKLAPFALSFFLTVAPLDVDVDAHLDLGEGLVLDGAAAAARRRRHLHREALVRLHSLHRPCLVRNLRDRFFGVPL